MFQGRTTCLMMSWQYGLPILRVCLQTRNDPTLLFAPESTSQPFLLRFGVVFYDLRPWPRICNSLIQRLQWIMLGYRCIYYWYVMDQIRVSHDQLAIDAFLSVGFYACVFESAIDQLITCAAYTWSLTSKNLLGLPFQSMTGTAEAPLCPPLMNRSGYK